MCVHGHSSPRPRMSTRHSKACRRHRITEQLWSCTNYSSAAANVGTTTLCTVKAGPTCVLATSSRASAPAGADGGSVLVRRCFACGQVRCFACGRRAICTFPHAVLSRILLLRYVPLAVLLLQVPCVDPTVRSSEVPVAPVAARLEPHALAQSTDEGSRWRDECSEGRPHTVSLLSFTGGIVVT